MILRDFLCSEGHVFEELTKSKMISCPICGKKAKITMAYTPAKTFNTNDSFNAHYDLQLGQHFESLEHKKKFLKETGREQLSGPLSPRKSNKSNVICTRKQAIKEFGHTYDRKRGRIL